MNKLPSGSSKLDNTALYMS